MQIGLLGKPNVGKSTFFSAATLKDVEIADYPFTTIKPNVGVAHVRVKCPHSEMERPCNPRKGRCLDGTRFVPVELYDVAGLVPGAHQGKGLGNQFLDDARQARVLLMVVDASGRTDREGNSGKGHPVEDVKFVEEEFDRWVAGIVARLLQNKAGTTEEVLVEGLSGLEFSKEAILKALDEAYPSASDSLSFATTLRRLGKPIGVVANRVDLEGSDEWLKELKTLGLPVVPTSAATEMLLRKASEAGFISYLPGASGFEVLRTGSQPQADALEFARQFLKKYGSTGVQQALDLAGFELGHMLPVFPVEDENKWTDGKGQLLPDCLLVPAGTSAKQLAYLIHTDIGDKFVKAVDGRTKQAHGADYPVEAGQVLKISTRR